MSVYKNISLPNEHIVYIKESFSFVHMMYPHHLIS